MGVNEMAALNGRKIPKSDKVFGINTMANEMAKEKGRDAASHSSAIALMKLILVARNELAATFTSSAVA